MATWAEFVGGAPRIAGIFSRRHAATGNLCVLATLSVEAGGGHLDITIWKPGEPERVVRKH
jgi:hypothetical protein